MRFASVSGGSVPRQALRSERSGSRGRSRSRRAQAVRSGALRERGVVRALARDALDFGWVDLPVFDEWGYPRHERGVTVYPGLYAVGLPWLYSEPSFVFAGVGSDAEHVVAHIKGSRVRGAP